MDNSCGMCHTPGHRIAGSISAAALNCLFHGHLFNNNNYHNGTSSHGLKSGSGTQLVAHFPGNSCCENHISMEL